MVVTTSQYTHTSNHARHLKLIQLYVHYTSIKESWKQLHQKKNSLKTASFFFGKLKFNQGRGVKNFREMPSTNLKLLFAFYLSP